VAWRDLGRWLASEDPPRRVDVLVVAPGSPDSRIPAAIRTARRGLASEIWVILSSDGSVLRERDAIRGYARVHHSPAPIRFLGRSQTLIRDAKLVRTRIEASDDRPSVAVLTAPIRVARTRLVLERTLREDVQIWSDGTPYNAGRWWRAHRVTTTLEAAKVLATFALIGPAHSGVGASPSPLRPLRAAAAAVAIAFVVGGLCRVVARRMGFVALPRLWRAHSKPTPMLGGAAILAGLIGGAVASGGVRIGSEGVVAAVGVVVLAMVGLVDDIGGLGSRTRLVWAGIAGIVAWLLGLRAEVFGAGTLADVGNIALTLLWFVGITHALNVLDHIDGVTAGVGAASAGTIAAVAALNGQTVVSVAAAALGGACIGYLIHNVHPARLFMGDMGALALGFALASLALALRSGQHPPLSLGLLVLVVGVPIFDTAVVTISRMRAGRRVALGGTDHSSHRLIARGFSVRRAAATLWAAQLALGLAAVALNESSRAVGWIIVILVALGGLAAFILFLRMDPWTPPTHHAVSESTKRAVARAIASLEEFDEMAARDGLATTDPDTTRAVRDAARRLETVRSHLQDAPDPDRPD
jgi:UDP-GlcNAc:undecaprenyl-phosphate/decaprenyl-phosphate GlcNAc-1-phosphate transferase